MLAAQLKADRIARRLTWNAYADFLGVAVSTLYKIAAGETDRPHELTVAQIHDVWAAHPVPGQQPTTNTSAEGAADAMVSDGQRHPERS